MVFIRTIDGILLYHYWYFPIHLPFPLIKASCMNHRMLGFFR